MVVRCEEREGKVACMEGQQADARRVGLLTRNAGPPDCAPALDACHWYKAEPAGAPSGLRLTDDRTGHGARVAGWPAADLDRVEEGVELAVELARVLQVDG